MLTKKWNIYNDFTPTQRKMEWQAGDKIESLWDGFIQFRPSGVRVKAPTCFPALVAMVQVPIVGKYRRRLTIREGLRLFGYPESYSLDMFKDNKKGITEAFDLLGNTVVIPVIKDIATRLAQIVDEKKDIN